MANPAVNPTPPGGDPLYVLVNFALEPAYQAQIRAVSPRVQLDISMVPEDGAAAAPAGGAPAAAGWRGLDAAELAPLVARSQVWFTLRLAPEWLDQARNLRWLQLTSAGADHLVAQGFFERRPDLLVTTASGIHAIPISEQVIGYILVFARGLQRAWQAQQAGRWDRFTPGEAAGQTLGIVGYGPIGRRTAALAQALGMRVLVLRRTAQAGPDGPVARFYSPGELPALLAASDYVLLAAPLTAETRGLIDAAALAQMRPTAILMNIGRGGLVDEPALIAALQRGQIGGAALDVFATEPLPADSPLWALPNVLITPHVAGANPHYNERATALFCANLQRYLAGEPLHNLVDPRRGY